MSNLSNPIFYDEAKAREWLEARVWPNGPTCPHCGVVGQATLLKGKSHRPGLYQCNACREPFTVTVGTLYERSKVPLHKWLAVTHLMMASKKGMSALQISRMIGLSYKTTWFLCHRIRKSLKPAPGNVLGGTNKVVEADESYVGGKAKNRAHREPAPKKTVFSLVEREGHVRSFHVANVTAKTLAPIIAKNAGQATAIMTDEATVLPSSRQGVREPWNGEPLSKRICPPRRVRPHQHCRELFLDPQARDHRFIPPRKRGASASLPW